jgi:hypothetical protein
VRTVYEALIASRNRLADLPPLTTQDLEDVALAMNELVWLVMTPPGRAKPALDVGGSVLANLTEAARDRDLDLYATTVAVVARKLGQRSRSGPLKVDQLAVVGEALDALTFDFAEPKKATLSALRELRSDLDARIAYVTAFREKGYRFQARPELYADRKDKSEGPDRFFRRVYGDHARRGLTQADVRGVDPAYYNVLHVWCTRHKRKLSTFLAPSRRSRGR